MTSLPCLEWLGYRDKDGYGIVSIHGQKFRAPRRAWELENKQTIPEGMCVRHTCDNPPCVEPTHLILGTRKDNNQDMVDRGRHPWQKKAFDTHCSKGHELTPDNLVGFTFRKICRLCHNERIRRRRAERKAGK